jgi:hypothetical protein
VKGNDCQIEKKNHRRPWSLWCFLETTQIYSIFDCFYLLSSYYLLQH